MKDKAMTKYSVRWNVCDGYVGGDRPQTVSFDVSDFAGMNETEARAALESIISDDFDSKVAWDCPKFDTYIADIMREAAMTEKPE
jgi:hypothetical protein